MSHTSTISAVKITDINALRAAVNDLNAQGVSCRLVENKVPVSNTTGRQAGMSEPAEFCLEIDNASYDIGIYNIGNGQHECRTDFWNGSVEAALGADASYVNSIDGSTPEGREEREMARLGLLYTRYEYHAVNSAVAIQGGSVEETVLEDGSIQLVCRAAA